MSRRHAAEKRNIASDVRNNSNLLAKFINRIMLKGKKALAEKIVYKSFDQLKKKHNVDPFETFCSAIDNIKPFLEVISVRVGGSNYQVPSPVDEARAHALASRWIIDATKKRSEKTMLERLAGELFDASNNRGGAFKKKEDNHKMAEANRAFAHFCIKKSRSN